MCLSFGGNSEDTIATSDVNEDPSSVRVKLKNETPSLSEDGANFRVGVTGGGTEGLGETLALSDLDSLSASSSLESGVGMPIDWVVGGESVPAELLRDKGRLLL